MRNPFFQAVPVDVGLIIQSSRRTYSRYVSNRTAQGDFALVSPQSRFMLLNRHQARQAAYMTQVGGIQIASNSLALGRVRHSI
jgi:hypothetical protein